MPAFIATYIGPAGQSRSLTVKASDLSQARKLLRRRGIRAEELKPAGENIRGDESRSSGLLSLDFNKLFEKPPGVKEKAIFNSQTRRTFSHSTRKWQALRVDKTKQAAANMFKN